MRNITVSGNLATDPEILTRGDGSNYTKFRIGNHEFSDGKDGDTKYNYLCRNRRILYTYG